MEQGKRWRLFQSLTYCYIRIDNAIPLEKVTYEFVNELEILEPFGKENLEPIFGTKNVIADLIEVIGSTKQTLRFNFSLNKSKRKLKAICFNKVEEFSKMLQDIHGTEALKIFQSGKITNIKLDIVYNIFINEYKNNRYVNMKIIDFRIKS